MVQVIPAFGSRKKLQTNVWKIKNITERFLAQFQHLNIWVVW